FARPPERDFRPGSVRTLIGQRPFGLAPLIAACGNEQLTLMRDGPRPTDLSIFRGTDLLAVFDRGEQDDDDDWPIDLPLPKPVPGRLGAAVLVLQKGEASLVFF